jgi:hypothetical protein
MSEPVVFTQAQAQRIWAAVRQMEQSGRREAGYDRIRPTTTRAENIYLYNESSTEIIPPYAAVEVTYNRFDTTQPFEFTQNGVVLNVGAPRPSSGFALETAILFNSGQPIEPGGIGIAQTGNLVVCRFRGDVKRLQGDDASQANEKKPIVFPSIYAGLSTEGFTTQSGEDPNFSLVHYDTVGTERSVGYRNIVVPLVRLIGEIQKFDNFAGDQSGGFEPPPDASPTSFYGGKVPATTEEDPLIRYCVGERLDMNESPVVAWLKVKKSDIDVDSGTGEASLSVPARLLATDNLYRFFGRGDLDATGRFVTAIFPYDPREWFKGSTTEISILAMRTNEGNFDTTYQIDSSEAAEGFPVGSNGFLVLTPPPPFNCEAVRDCLEDEEFDFCSLVQACLDDDDFNDFFCEKVLDCLGLEEDEDIDDRIDQRLQELCTCDTFIDGVSIVGNDWVFTTNEICYVACPDGGGGAGANITIEGTDCPEDEPGEPEP